MNMTILLGKLRHHKLELGRLKGEEEREKKKGITLSITVNEDEYSLSDVML